MTQSNAANSSLKSSSWEVFVVPTNSSLNQSSASEFYWPILNDEASLPSRDTIRANKTPEDIVAPIFGWHHLWVVRNVSSGSFASFVRLLENVEVIVCEEINKQDSRYYIGCQALVY